MIAFNCPSCKKTLKVKDELAGKRGKCPHCQNPVVIPAAAPVVAGPGKMASPAATAQAPPSPSPAHVATMAQEDTPSAADEGPPKLDFLAPPQKPGELGRLGPYRVLKVLGAGGMGMVLQAEDPALKRAVALKVMRPEIAAKDTNRQRFIREAQATAAIEHPNIVAIHQVGQDRGVPFIAMPFLKGETLDSRLKRELKLPVAEAIRIGKQIAEGLAAAHEHGLIHRDIKPANLWLEAKTNLVKIVDFGLARSLGGDDVQITKSGAILGTPAYMAPEQAVGEKVDHRCDLFSLGAVLYRTLTGELPFKGQNTMAILMALASDTPRPIRELNPSIPKPVADLIMQLLAKAPDTRPSSAKAVADALVALEEGRTQVLEGKSTIELAKGAGVAAKGLKIGFKGFARLLWLILRLYRIPGRTGLVIKGATGLLVLAIVVFLLVKSGTDGERKVGSAIATRPGEPPPLAVAPFNEQEAKEYQKQWADHLKVPVEITNSIGIQLTLIPPGEFMMGSPENEATRRVDEGPQHKVKVTKPIYIGVFEVKQSEYEKVMGKNPSAFKDSPDHPVEKVNWNEADAFCKKLSEIPAEVLARRTYRLPSEAQWEYACRAGTTTVFHYGNSLSSKQANFKGDEPYGGAEKGVRVGKTVKCGTYEANPWGLYDMHGNVWEWCLDGPRTYQKGVQPIDDPKGDLAAGSRVLRGGSWYNAALNCRSAARPWPHGSERLFDYGFRMVCEVADRSARNQDPGEIQRQASAGVLEGTGRQAIISPAPP